MNIEVYQKIKHEWVSRGWIVKKIMEENPGVLSGHIFGMAWVLEDSGLSLDDETMAIRLSRITDGMKAEETIAIMRGDEACRTG